MMTAFELLAFLQKPIKSLSEVGIKTTDYRYVSLYREYLKMKKEGKKRDYILEVLSIENNISISSIRRIIKRFSGEVKM